MITRTNATDREWDIAAQAAARVLKRIPGADRGGDPLAALGFALGEEITYEAGMTLLAAETMRIAEADTSFFVMARMGRNDPESIIGCYRTRLEADAVAEAWNRRNGDVATYYVEDQEEDSDHAATTADNAGA